MMHATSRSDCSATRRFREQFRLAAKERADAGKPRIMYDTSKTDPTMRVSAGGIGGEFVISRMFRSFQQRFPASPPRGEWQTDPVPVDLRLRTLVASADTSAGDLVRPDCTASWSLDARARSGSRTS